MNKYCTFFLTLLLLGCTNINKDEIDYKKYNERFNFENRDDLFASLENHFKKAGNTSALKNLKKIGFINECEGFYQILIEEDKYDFFIEESPEEFMCFIEHLNSLGSKKDYHKVYFKSSQALLRFLNPLTLLK